MKRSFIGHRKHVVNPYMSHCSNTTFVNMWIDPIFKLDNAHWKPLQMSIWWKALKSDAVGFYLNNPHFIYSISFNNMWRNHNMENIFASGAFQIHSKPNIKYWFTYNKAHWNQSVIVMWFHFGCLKRANKNSHELFINDVFLRQKNIFSRKKECGAEIVWN